MKDILLPKRIDCTVLYEQEPIADLMLLAEFKTVRKNCYDIIFGPSDQQGKAAVAYDEIKKQADSQLELALMDYDPIDKAYDGNISVKVMGSEEIKNAISAYELFKSVGWYPTNYLENLKKALKMLRQIDVTSIETNYDLK